MVRYSPHLKNLIRRDIGRLRALSRRWREVALLDEIVFHPQEDVAHRVLHVGDGNVGDSRLELRRREIVVASASLENLRLLCFGEIRVPEIRVDDFLRGLREMGAGGWVGGGGGGGSERSVQSGRSGRSGQSRRSGWSES